MGTVTLTLKRKRDKYSGYTIRDVEREMFTMCKVFMSQLYEQMPLTDIENQLNLMFIHFRVCQQVNAITGEKYRVHEEEEYVKSSV